MAGALQAGITTLVGQATVSLYNNTGDLNKVFDELGSSDSVKNLLTAMVTGCVLAGLDLNPTGQATANAGQQEFIDQLTQNVKAGAATALIKTAINGGSLADNLTDSLKLAFLNTVAAQTANEIGDLELDAFINKVAHAMAGCAVGAANAGNAAGCAAGAIGAAIGEMTAEAIGRRDDTVAVASLMAGIAAAIAGGDAAQVSLAAGAGGNAAANNYLNHDQQSKFRSALESCNGEPTCIQRETAKWEDLERQQSAAAASCKTVSECTKISQTARTGIGFTLADAQAMCGGVQGCVDFATDLGRRDVYDEVNARDVGYANALAARRAQLLAAGLDPDSATIGAGITPGDAASAVGGVVAAALGGLRGAGASTPALTGANGGALPSGFANASEFANFGGSVRGGLKNAGYPDVEPILQGSAVTGKSFGTGAPFDVGRVSDFDVALASPSLLQRAQELGIGVRSGGTRTGPLTARDLEALGLTSFASGVSAQAGRQVNFMIYQSSAAAAQRAPSISLPGGKN